MKVKVKKIILKLLKKIDHPEWLLYNHIWIEKAVDEIAECLKKMNISLKR